MSEIAKDPSFRSQYEGGVKEDPQVEAALSGQLDAKGGEPLPMTREVRQTGQFGPMVRLR